MFTHLPSNWVELLASESSLGNALLWSEIVSYGTGKKKKQTHPQTEAPKPKQETKRLACWYINWTWLGILIWGSLTEIVTRSISLFSGMGVQWGVAHYVKAMPKDSRTIQGWKVARWQFNFILYSLKCDGNHSEWPVPTACGRRGLFSFF